MYTLIFLLLFYCILRHAGLSVFYAYNGLNLWYTKMIPTLLPFMILSSIANRLNLTEKIASLAAPIVMPIFRVRRNVIFCMLLGFLCGFPMGAKVTADMYREGKITRPEADYLLSFCNNIGPVYFVGFLLPLLGLESILIPVMGMYGIPLLWGLLLRFCKFRWSIKGPSWIRRKSGNRRKWTSAHRELILAFAKKQTLLAIMEESIVSSLCSIASLGGYMVLFNCLNLPFHILFQSPPILIAPILEISGGLILLGKTLPKYSLIAVSLGGLSCIAQTYSCIKGTDLSIHQYIANKLVLTALSALFYCFFLL